MLLLLDGSPTGLWHPPCAVTALSSTASEAPLLAPSGVGPRLSSMPGGGKGGRSQGPGQTQREGLQAAEEALPQGWGLRMLDLVGLGEPCAP